MRLEETSHHTRNKKRLKSFYLSQTASFFTLSVSQLRWCVYWFALQVLRLSLHALRLKTSQVSALLPVQPRYCGTGSRHCEPTLAWQPYDLLRHGYCSHPCVCRYAHD